MLYKKVGDVVPVVYPDSYLKPETTSYADYIRINILKRHTSNNTRPFGIPSSLSEQYEDSFFTETLINWNHLEANSACTHNRGL